MCWHPLPGGGDRRFDFVPKGHFDGIRSLILSGTLYQLVSSGKNIFAISNVDNLVATVEPILVTMLYLSGKPVLCEVNAKQPGEPVGGSLVCWKEDFVPAGQPQLQLREGFEFGNVKDKNNSFTRLSLEEPQAYSKKFGFNNTANYHFWLPDIPGIFGIKWRELEELDRLISQTKEQTNQGEKEKTKPRRKENKNRRL